ncbi:MAG: MmgE/PrpD family protein [Acetobacteraceae bacterium]|nr:MmgE/PrpD family protein [Acetobacteraceae bacterium]
MTTPTLLQRLAMHVAAFGPADITPRAIHLARTAIIDTLGVTLAGAVEPAAAILRDLPGVAAAGGPCTVFGTTLKTSLLDAAFANGVASHALDYDDFSEPMGGHQSVPLVSPLMAVAEARGLSGAQLLAAYLVGIETEIRFARAVNFVHYDKGWHPTATVGIFGTVAAVAHLVGLPEATMTTAFGIAASLASGLKANFGTMVKPLHIGQSARNGLLAVMLAERGYDSNPLALEHPQGYLNVFNGPGQFDARLLFADWASPLEILSSSMGLKQYPCCGSTHPAIAAMLALREQEGIRADDVAAIEVMPHGRRLRHTDNPNPTTPLQAKFSVQYVVARALLDGAVRLGHFEGDAPVDPAIRALLAKTVATAHPDMEDDSEHQFSAEVRVRLTDGRTVSRRVDNLVGRGGDQPISSQELWGKFSDCGARSLLPDTLRPLFDRLQQLEEIADIRELTELLAPRSRLLARAS